MIQLRRDREKHKIGGRLKFLVPGGLHGHHLRNKCRLLLEHKRSKGQFSSKDFKSNYWKPAKEQLKAEVHKKCAYCEAPVTVVAHGDVEHYRPKSEYWWLAYCYDNYLYSCQICNQVYKGNHFPVQGPPLQGPDIDGGSTDAILDDWQTRLCPDPVRPGEGYTHAQYIADHLAERPLLLNPYMDDPEQLLAWKVSEPLREVRMVPVEGDAFSASVVQAMEKYYGLNREELRRRRYTWYLLMKALADDIKDPRTHPDVVMEKKEDMKRFLEPDVEYTGMTQYFVEKVWELELD